MDRTPIRVLLAKVGLDGHDRGVKTVAHYLKAAGMEVAYTGMRATPDEVAAAALLHDADVVGLSFLAGDHMVLAPKVLDALKSRGPRGVTVLAGGVILKRDVAALERMGVKRVFLPGTPPAQIVEYIESNVTRRSIAEEQTQ
jgi:methylmalonyl-CoA mutase C-terminal domain/subunit